MLLLGDSAKVLRAIKDSAVDLVLTDPPYGLSFMGKAWDRSTPEAVIFAECYRVLKPGAFILVMASPRNDDLVSIALREAGFIKHNSIYWVYGSGFPKGTDVSKQIDAQAVREWLDGKDHGLTAAEVRKVISAAVNGEVIEAGDTSLMSGMSGQKGSRERERDRTEGARLIESLESRFGPMPKRVKVGEAKDFARDGYKRIPEKHNKTATVDTPNNEGDKRWAQNITAPATPLAQEWEGFKYGIQALKPAAEVILVFQKPFDGKPLDSIVKWGVGAINVDGGRIAGSWKWGTQTDIRCGGYGSKRPSNGDIYAKNLESNPQGRYPSNFIISHAPGCRVAGERRVRTGTAIGENKTPSNVYNEEWGEREIGYADADGREAVKDWTCVDGCPVKLFDAQSGERCGGGKRKPEWSKDTPQGLYTPPRANYTEYNTHGDTGTASRFFYQPECSNADPFIYEAKASSRERNAGCEGLKEGPPPQTARSKAAEGRQNPLGEPRQNYHPTVKPVELFRYLIKLFRGKGQVILDPFVGSGTTCVAAVLEGVKCIGIDAEPEYIQIAQAREKHWTKYRSEYLTTGQIPVVKEAELPLFEETL